MKNEKNKTEEKFDINDIDYIFDKKVEPRRSSSPKTIIRTKIVIDFWAESFSIYLIISQTKKNNNTQNNTNKLITNLINGNKQEKILSKRFKVSEDYTIVTIDNYEFYVPIFFNKESLKTKDEKTWQMLFYYLYKREVNQAIKNAKLLYEKQK